MKGGLTVVHLNQQTDSLNLVTKLTTLVGHTAELNTLTLDGDLVASGSSDKTVRLFDWKSGNCLHVLKGHCKYCTE